MIKKKISGYQRYFSAISVLKPVGQSGYLLMVDCPLSNPPILQFSMSFSTLHSLDHQLSARLRVAEKPGPLRTVAIVLAHSGDSPLWLAGLALTIWLGDAFWRWEAELDLAGVLVTAALVQTLKLIFRRQRPVGEWGQGYRKLDPHSFPSGHAARAFMLAAIAIGLGPVWWAAFMGVWAILVALARVAMGVHYLSDVIVGGVVGVLAGVGVLWMTRS
jgi:undecaprenyl-diphosphatase